MLRNFVARASALGHRSFHTGCRLDVTDRPLFPGSRSRWTEKLEFVKQESDAVIPVYRVTGRDGKVIDSTQDPQLGQELTTRIYKGESGCCWE